MRRASCLRSTRFGCGGKEQIQGEVEERGHRFDAQMYGAQAAKRQDEGLLLP